MLLSPYSYVFLLDNTVLECFRTEAGATVSTMAVRAILITTPSFQTTPQVEPLAEVCKASSDSIPEPNKLVFNSQAVAYLRYIKINKIKLIFNKRK